MTRTCVYVRIACTRNDRLWYDNRVAALTHYAIKRRTCEEDYPSRRWLVVSSFDDGSLSAILVTGNDFPESRIFRRGREREEGSSWCAEARHWNRLYISRSLSPRDLISSSTLCVCLSLFPRSLFLSSLLSSPLLSLRGLPLRGLISLFWRLVSRSRGGEIGWRTAREVSRGRARTVLAGASTSIFLRFIAARLRNASNAVHAA